LVADLEFAHMTALAHPSRLVWTGFVALSVLIVAAAAAPVLALAGQVIA
jgi:hypothetical protein